ncbi:hypothetical protein ACOME3_001322 [Neoechinorhynchus agilis]
MIASSLGKFTILLKSLSNFSVQFRGFSSSAVSRTKTRDRYDKHEASIRQINRDEHLKSFFMFGGAIQVTEETHEQSFDGSIYKHLNVLYVHSSQNNTIATLVDGTTLSNPHPRVIYSSSCGAIGFKNARKGTTVAAQTLGTAMGEQMLRRKITKGYQSPESISSPSRTIPFFMDIPLISKDLRKSEGCE